MVRVLRKLPHATLGLASCMPFCFEELVSNLFFRIDDLGLGMITISEFEKHFNDETFPQNDPNQLYLKPHILPKTE